MADDLRSRVLAAVRKGLAGPVDTSKMKKPVLRSYSVDFATESGVTAQATCNTASANEIKDVTPLHPFAAKSDTQRGKDPTEPAAGPDRTKLSIIEIPATRLRYRRTFAQLQLKPPSYIPEDRWRIAIEDGRAFLQQWGETAQRLGWTSADLFGLHIPPEQPHPSYRRLSRYDQTGLIWLLQRRLVVALTADTAAIENPETGSITTYRRFNKPALGPLGDSLDDLA